MHVGFLLPVVPAYLSEQTVPENFCRGRCLQDGTCECARGFGGKACEKECPGGYQNQCLGRGECDHVTMTCVCDSLYEGKACERFADWFVLFVSFASATVIVSTAVYLRKRFLRKRRAKRRKRREKRNTRARRRGRAIR